MLSAPCIGPNQSSVLVYFKRPTCSVDLSIPIFTTRRAAPADASKQVRLTQVSKILDVSLWQRLSPGRLLAFLEGLDGQCALGVGVQWRIGVELLFFFFHLLRLCCLPRLLLQSCTDMDTQSRFAHPNYSMPITNRERVVCCLGSKSPCLATLGRPKVTQH